MRCGNCGKELLPQDKFCSQCGTAVPPQDVFCSQCGKKLTTEDRFCSQCGTAVASQAKPSVAGKDEILFMGGLSGNATPTQVKQSSQPETKTGGIQKTEWPKTSVNREGLLDMLASNQNLFAINERLIAIRSDETMKQIVESAAVRYTASELIALAAIKKIDKGIEHTPEPVALTERKAYLQEALIVVEKAITPELQASDSKSYTTLVAKKAATLSAIKKINDGQISSQVVFCPHCHKWTDNGFTHCVHCYKSVNPSASRPVPQAAEQPGSAPASKSAPAPASKSAPAPTPQPVPKPVPAAHPQAGTAQVRYADDSIKDWKMLPGEKSVRSRHVIGLMQPDGGKFIYSMEVTDRRILLWKESNKSLFFGSVASMGGGLLGHLIAEGAKAAVGGGRKPWLEIPLTAISSCGVRNKEEFFIVADQTYVLQNMKYDKLLPDLIANAKK